MKHFIKFLGTGAGDFYTHDDKPGDIGGKDIRHPPSLFISPNVMVDFHDDWQLAGFSIPKDSIRHLLIAHGHYDHFRPVRIHNFARELSHPLSVYGNGTIIDALDFASEYEWDRAGKVFLKNNHGSNVDPVLAEPGASFLIDDLRVTPALANHFFDTKYEILGQKALNYVFERNGKTLFYGLDSSYVLPGTFEMLSKLRLDIAVFDATWCQREIDPAVSGHLNWVMLDETIAQFNEGGLFAEDAVIIADHLSVNTIEPYDEIAGKLSDKGITLAYDGMTLEF